METRAQTAEERNPALPGSAPLSERLRDSATLLRMMSEGEARLSRRDVRHVAAQIGGIAAALDAERRTTGAA